MPAGDTGIEHDPSLPSCIAVPTCPLCSSPSRARLLRDSQPLALQLGFMLQGWGLSWGVDSEQRKIWFQMSGASKRNVVSAGPVSYPRLPWLGTWRFKLSLKPL